MATAQSYVTNPNRRRSRKERIKVDGDDIARRVHEFYRDCWDARAEGREARVQREAKLRMWREGKDWPWEDASDVAIPDMAEKSLRAQDTIFNAVVGNRPAIGSIASNRADRSKEQVIDNLHDFQLFEEQDGEAILTELIETFINDPACIAYIPWVRELREVQLSQIFDPIPEEMEPAAYFAALIGQEFPDALAEPRTDAGWDWTVEFPDQFDERNRPRKFKLSFYTRDSDSRVEAVRTEPVVVYDGPRILPKDFDDVLFPAGAANLQPPSPSNPRGAPFVVLVDYPTVDEISRLAKAKHYALTDEEVTRLAARARDTTIDRPKEQFRNDAEGTVEIGTLPRDGLHRTVTRLTCFDLYDVDGSGVARDVVWTVIDEIQALVKSALVSDIYPAPSGGRPLAAVSYLPVRGRLVGQSLNDLTEGLHDAMKALVDQSIDASTIQIVPWGAYRPQSAINAAPIRISPGELYPLDDPQRDLNIPNLTNNAVATGINLFTLLSQQEERVSMMDATAFGQVPSGSASALRTTKNMQALLGQGQSRPERVLRRFFRFLAEIHQIMYHYNVVWLPREKQIKLAGLRGPNEDPYLTISDRTAIKGDFTFTFRANAFNASAESRIAGLQTLLPLYVNPLMIQLGIVTPDGIYRMVRALGREVVNQDVDEYLQPPTPQSHLPRVLAEDILAQIVNGQQPTQGWPLEPGGWQEHIQRLVTFAQSEDLGFVPPEQVQVLAQYMAYAQQQLLAQMQQMMMAAQAFQQTAQQGEGGETGRPAETPAQQPQNPQISGGGELMDERLPGAGGGANQG